MRRGALGFALLTALAVGFFALETLTKKSEGSVVSWDLVGISADQRTLYIEVGRGDCDRIARPDVDEDSDRVEIAVRVVDEMPIGGSCTSAQRLEHLGVRLERPLGSRKVVGTRIARKWGRAPIAPETCDVEAGPEAAVANAHTTVEVDDLKAAARAVEQRVEDAGGRVYERHDWNDGGERHRTLRAYAPMGSASTLLETVHELGRIEYDFRERYDPRHRRGRRRVPTAGER